MIQKHLKEYYTHQLSHEANQDYSLWMKILSQKRDWKLEKQGDDVYKHHMDIHAMSGWTEDDIEHDLKLSHKEWVSYVPQSTPQLNIENLNEDFSETIMPEFMFVIKIIVMKYKIEVPVLNIRNTIPFDNDAIPFEIHDLTLYILRLTMTLKSSRRKYMT